MEGKMSKGQPQFPAMSEETNAEQMTPEKARRKRGGYTVNLRGESLAYLIAVHADLKSKGLNPNLPQAMRGIMETVRKMLPPHFVVAHMMATPAVVDPPEPSRPRLRRGDAPKVDVESIIRDIANSAPGLYTIPKMKDVRPELERADSHGVDHVLKRMSKKGGDVLVLFAGDTTKDVGGTYKEWLIKPRKTRCK